MYSPNLPVDHTGIHAPSTNVGKGSDALSCRIMSASESRNIVEAHLKSLKAYRRACRLIPWALAYHGMMHMTNHASSKEVLARFWRMNGRIRNPARVDDLVNQAYERMSNLQQPDIWKGEVWDFLAPQSDGGVQSLMGHSFESEKYAKKSKFLKNFYEGKLKPKY